MYTPSVVLLFVASLLFGACGSKSPALTADLDHYVAAQQALAADDFSAAKQALQALHQHSAPEAKALAEMAAQAKDIKAMRIAFRTLSAHITDQAVPAGLVLAYCPMVEGNKIGYWFQREGDIKNPYFGKSMLNCGGFPDSKTALENTP